MKFSGKRRIAAPPELVWPLLADPEAMPRYSPQVSRVHLLSGGEGVGARSYTMVLAGGRSFPCEEFVSVWEPPRRLVSTFKVTSIRGEVEYDLSVPSVGAAGFRDAADSSDCELRWFGRASFASPWLWVVAPLALFIPVFMLASTGKRQRESIEQLARVAEADARGR